MSIDRSPEITVRAVQSIYPALDTGLNDDGSVNKMEDARMSKVTAGVQAVHIQGLSTQIKAWVSSLNISGKQQMELLRMRKGLDGRESEIVRSIKGNFMIPKVAGIVEGQLRGRVIVPTSEPYTGAMPKNSESFKLMIDIPEKSDWGTPKP